MLTAALAAKLIRQILVDYNFWPTSESDSPLRVFRSKTVLDDKAILSRDASMRRTAVGDVTPPYKPPSRQVECKTLDQVFQPLVSVAVGQAYQGIEMVVNGTAELEGLEMPIEQSEFLVQLYSAFKQLANHKVCYVVNGNNVASDPYTGLFITGESSDGEVIIAQTLLIQT